MSNLLKLGLRDLPLDEVILIKTIFRLSSEQLSSTWVLVEHGPVDAWLADSASWDKDQAQRAAGESIAPTLYLSRLHSAAMAPVLVRPIRAQALLQWLAETGWRGSGAEAPAEAVAAVAAVTAQEDQWAATVPAGLPFMEPVRAAAAPTERAEPLLIPEPVAPAKPAVTMQFVAGAESTGQSALGVLPDAIADTMATQQLDPDSRYLLRRWPPAQIMGNDPKRLRITSLLSKQALQVDELSNLSGASIEECEGWMSTLLHSELLDTRAGAVAAVGGGHSMAEKLTAEQSAALTPASVLSSAPKRTLSLVSAIRRRLGI